MERISSTQNPRVKHWQSLAREPKLRRDRRELWVEGPRFIETALRAGWKVKTLLCLEGRFPRTKNGMLCADETFDVSERVMQKCATTASPPPAAAVVSMLARPKELPSKGRFVLLCGLQDPGNVGGVIRSVHGAGWDGVVLFGTCADPYAPKTLRASAGSAFFVPLYTSDMKVLHTWKKAGVALVGADAHGGETNLLPLASLTACALVMGEEGRGMPDEIFALCDRRLHVPLTKDCESLNTAAAAAILLFGWGKADFTKRNV